MQFSWLILSRVHRDPTELVLTAFSLFDGPFHKEAQSVSDRQYLLGYDFRPIPSSSGRSIWVQFSSLFYNWFERVFDWHILMDSVSKFETTDSYWMNNLSVMSRKLCSKYRFRLWLRHSVRWFINSFDGSEYRISCLRGTHSKISNESIWGCRYPKHRRKHLRMLTFGAWWAWTRYWSQRHSRVYVYMCKLNKTQFTTENRGDLTSGRLPFHDLDGNLTPDRGTRMSCIHQD